MIWWQRFRAWQAERERQRSLRNIRECMAFFGHDMSGVSDEEIEEGVKRMGEVVAQCGVSAEELEEAARFVGMLYVIPSEPGELVDTPERALQAGRVLGVVNEVGRQIRDA